MCHAPSEVTTQRLVLRRLAVADAAALHEAAAQCLQELIYRFPNEVPMLASPEGAASYVEQVTTNWITGAYLEYGIFEQGERLIGDIALECEQASRQFDASLWLRPSARRKGYASEALSAVMSMAFDTLGGRLVEMGIDPDNDACLALANRLGFSSLPTLEEEGYFPGTREGRRLQFGMTRDRWDNRRAGRQGG